MAANKLNLPLYSLLLSLVPWFYYIFAELLPPFVVMRLAPISYVCMFVSIVMAIIAFGKKLKYSKLALTALSLNILYIVMVIHHIVACKCF